MLIRTGVLQSTLGGSGSGVMGRDPATISLLDVSEAVTEQELEFFSVDNSFSDWKGRQAERLGLISRVLVDDDVLSEAVILAETFASKSPTVILGFRDQENGFLAFWLSGFLAFWLPTPVSRTPRVFVLACA